MTPWKAIFCVGLLLGEAASWGAQHSVGVMRDRVQVCTITLGSAHEKTVFQEELKPEDRYEFRELGPQGNVARGGGDDWFHRSCQTVREQGIHCDLLIISGHFGGDLFFGSARNFGARLTMQTLEAHACARSCEGILSDPAQVFLFGCNTLAGKSADHRTRQQYITALRADGIGMADAERIADARYGPFGDSFRDQMGRVFSGAGEVLGFDSVAPTGARVQGPLRQYLRRAQRGADGTLRSYEQRLREEEVRRWRGLLVAPERSGLGHQFEGKLEASCMNPAVLPLPGVGTTPWGQQIQAELCSLSDESRFYSERIEQMARLMASPEAAAYLPRMQRFFRQVGPTWNGAEHYYSDPAEQASLANLRRAKPTGFTQALVGLARGLTRFQLGFLGFQLGWITGSSALEELRADLDDVLRPRSGAARLDSDTVDYFCQIRKGLPSELRESLSGAPATAFRPARERRRLRECLGF